MKNQMLKMAGVTSQKEFYRLFPDEASFMKIHGKAFKKAMLGNNIKKAQTGTTQGGYNQQNAGMSTAATTDADVQSAISNLSTGTPKTTTGDAIAGVVKDIPIVGGLVQSVVDLFDTNENKKKERAGALSNIQLQAAQSAPRQQNREYNRPDKDAKVADINQSMPAEGTGTNLLGRDGITISRRGGEIANTFAPHDIYSNMGYEPLDETNRIKAYYNGGGIPQANFGSIVTNLLSSKGGSSGIMGMISGLLGGTTTETTTLDPSQHIMRNNFSPNYIRSRDGSIIPKAQNGMDNTSTGSNPNEKNSFVGNNLKGMGNAILGSDTFKTDPTKSTPMANNITQAAKTTASGMAAIPGLDNKQASAAGNIGSTVGGIFGPIGSAVGMVLGEGLGGILRRKGGDKAMLQAEANQNRMAGAQVANVMHSQNYANARTGGNIKQQNGGVNPIYALKDTYGEYAPLNTKEREEQEKQITERGAVFAPQERINEVMGVWDKNKMIVKDTYNKFNSYKDEDLNKLPLEDIWKLRKQNREVYSKISDSTHNEENEVPSKFLIDQIRGERPSSPEEEKLYKHYRAVSDSLGSSYGNFDKLSKQAMLLKEKATGLSNQELDKKYKGVVGLRTGGQLRQNSDMENNGELETLWGGYAEPISYNPYLGEETVMFKGKSHEEGNDGRTGIGVRYGEGGELQHYAEGGSTQDANVEVENNEPAVQLPDESGEKNLVVFGANYMNGDVAKLLNDPDAKNKTVKKYVNNLSLVENKQNKIIEKVTNELKDLNPKTPYEKIKFDTLAITFKGADQKLKDIAIKKNNVADWQNFHNKEAEARGIDPEKLSRGKLTAMKGAKVPKAQDRTRVVNAPDGTTRYYYSDGTFGITTGNLTVTYDAKGNEISRAKATSPPDVKPTQEQVVAAGNATNKKRPVGYPSANKLPNFSDLPKMSYENYTILKGLYDKASSKVATQEDILEFQRKYADLAPKYKARVDNAYPRMKSNNMDGLMGKRTIQYGQSLQDPGVQRMIPRPGEFNLSTPPPDIKPIEQGPLNPEKPKKSQFINPMGNYLPPNKEELDPRQLTGEYYALATNQVEPVPAQQYQPNLRTPYELSLQDILNENTAATRGAQRFMGYNPAAQSNLLAQQYGANSKVLGEQFRINQEFKDKIYGENTNILNDAQLKNLGILDTQYQRQAKALSNTKDTAREALSSISDKYLQNQLQNRTLATYENLYNYRYDRNQHAWNMNGPAQFNMAGNNTGQTSALPEDWETLYDKDGNPIKAPRKPREKSGRNGAILKAMRNL